MMKFFMINLIFIIVTSVSSVSNAREQEVYVLPENYIGSIHIIYNVSDGKKIEIKNGERVLKIPDNGVLLTQMNANKGWIRGDKVKFYYRSNNKMKEISEHWFGVLNDTPENRNDKKIRIFGGSFGSHESIYVGCKLQVESFYVGTKEDVLNENNYFDIVFFLKNNHVNCKGMDSTTINK